MDLKRKSNFDEVEGIAPKRSRTKDKTLSFGLEDLSDDVLLLIFKNLNSSDLLTLSEVSHRIHRVAVDESLWKTVDTVDAPLSPSRFRKLLNLIGPRTKAVRIGGKASVKTNSTTPSILQGITAKCQHLEELALHGCHIDAESIHISQFPSSIKKLKIVDSNVINISQRESFLFRIDQKIPHLETLDLSNSSWLSNHSLQAICKCDSLKEVILRGCRKLGECFVYTALATRFGFRSVQSVDLRDTCIGDAEVPCFGRLPHITRLLLGKTSASDDIPPPENSESNGRITDRGIMSMCVKDDSQDMGKLKVLSLMQTSVSDRSLMSLATSFDLSHLDVRGTNVTENGVSRYLLLRPSCTVLYDQVED